MRTMYDSVTPTDIPTSIGGRPPDLVAGYIDGVPRWPSSAWGRFPNSVHVRIALDPATPDGDVLDVERGAANPDQAPSWVQRRRAAGADPTVYCNAATWPTVRAQFAAQGVAEPHWWIAAYPGWTDTAGRPTLPPGAVAHQYTDPPASGGHWDLSVVADHWPGVEPNPAPPAPHITEDDMQLIVCPDRSDTQALVSGGLKCNLDATAAGADATIFPRLTVGADLWDRLEAHTNAVNALPAKVDAIAAAIAALPAAIAAVLPAGGGGGLTADQLTTAVAAGVRAGLDGVTETTTLHKPTS